MVANPPGRLAAVRDSRRSPRLGRRSHSSLVAFRVAIMVSAAPPEIMIVTSCVGRAYHPDRARRSHARASPSRPAAAGLSARGPPGSRPFADDPAAACPSATAPLVTLPPVAGPSHPLREAASCRFILYRSIIIQRHYVHFFQFNLVRMIRYGPLRRGRQSGQRAPPRPPEPAAPAGPALLRTMSQKSRGRAGRRGLAKRPPDSAAPRPVAATGVCRGIAAGSAIRPSFALGRALAAANSFLSLVRSRSKSTFSEKQTLFQCGLFASIGAVRGPLCMIDYRLFFNQILRL
jgi:hypothetical protein